MHFIQKQAAILAALPALFRLSAPIALGQLISISMLTADFWIMGRLSAFDLASGSLAVRVYQPLYFLCLGLLSIIASMVAQSIGAGRPEIARRIYRQGLILACLLGGILMLPILFGADILILLGQDIDIASYAINFFIYAAIGFPFTLIFLTMRFFTLGHRRIGAQLIASILMLGLNISLNPLLAYGLYGLPEMGLAGIALATTLSYMMACLVLGILIGLRAPFSETKPYQNWWRPDFELMKTMLKVGVPNACIVASETGMFIVAAFIVGLFGASALAAVAIANQIAAVVFMLPLSISQSCAIMVGQSAGAGRLEDVRAFGWAGGLAGLAIALPLTLLLAIYPETLARIFLRDGDPLGPETLAIVVPMLWITAMFQASDGAQAIFTANLRGLNDTRMPAFYGLICFWGVGIGSGAFMALYLGWGPVSVWSGLAVGLSLNALILTNRWHRQLQLIRDGQRKLLETSAS